MHGLRYICGILFCLSAFMGGAALAQETLVIGVENKDWYTHYVWEDPELKGLDPDVVRAVAARLGYQVIFEAYPWSRVIRMGEDKLIDGVLDLGHIKSREKYLHYVKTPLTTEQTVFWVKKGSRIPFDGTFTSEMRLGLIRGADWSDRFAQMGTPTVQRFDSFLQAFRNLAAGRIDMFASYHTPTIYHARRLGFLDQIEPHAYRRPLMSYYLAFSDKPGHASLAKRFNKELKAFFASPEYRALQEKYGIHSQ